MPSPNLSNSSPSQAATAGSGKEVSGYGARRLRAVERGLAVLEWLMAHPTTASIRDISEALGLDYNHCYRIVNSLLASGYLVRSGRGIMGPGPAFLRLLPVYLREDGPKELESLAAALRDKTLESTYVAIWDGQDVVLVRAIDGLHHVRVSSYDPGYKEAAYARATGKVILANLPAEELDRYLATHALIPHTHNTIVNESKLRAQLDRFRVEGVAYEWEELFTSACAIAAPLFGPRGEVVGGIAISVPESRFDVHLEAFRGALLGAGEEGSRTLGYQGAYPKPPPGSTEKS